MSAIAFRVRTTVKIGVRVYTTLTAMQSLHALGNLCVCVHMDVCICIPCLCLHVHKCICIFCIIPVCIRNYITHIPLVVPPSIVSGQTHSMWSSEYLCQGAFQETSTQHTLSCTAGIGESTSSALSLADSQLMCRDSSPLTSTLMKTPFPASAALHQVGLPTVCTRQLCVCAH